MGVKWGKRGMRGGSDGFREGAQRWVRWVSDGVRWGSEAVHKEVRGGSDGDQRGQMGVRGGSEGQAPDLPTHLPPSAQPRSPDLPRPPRTRSLNSRIPIDEYPEERERRFRVYKEALGTRLSPWPP